MRSKKIAALVAVGSAGAMLAIGTQPASAHPTAQRDLVVYHIAKDSTVTGPTHLAPGRVEIKVTGRKAGALQLIKAKKGSTAADLRRDAGELNKTGKPVDLEHDFILSGGIGTGHYMWLKMTRGTYYAVDTNGKQLSAAKITVAGKAQYTAFPKAAEISAIKSMSWANVPRGIKHAGVLHFVNHATQPHFINMIKLKKGKTLGDFRKVLAGKENPKDVVDPSGSLSTGVVSPYRSIYFDYSIPRGRYVLACFWPDHNGTPHALMGMTREINVHK